jgi:hypothetical protein
MPQRRRVPIEWKRIRRLFLMPQSSYTAAETSELLGIDDRTVRQAADEGTVTAIPPDGGLRIPWEDVVALGLEQRWTFRMLTEALRGRSGTALPPLVRVVAGRVALPRHQWQVLRHLAERRARLEYREITVDDLLEEAVSTAVLTQIEDWEELEASIPGVREAAAWPSGESEAEAIERRIAFEEGER